MQDYAARLRIPLVGASELPRLFTSSGVLFSAGYRRVVIGGRGPYIEYERKHIVCVAHKMRVSSHYYYEEWRSAADNIKLYEQKHKVKYADYVPGYFYVTPFDLWLDTGMPAIEPWKKNPKQGSLF